MKNQQTEKSHFLDSVARKVNQRAKELQSDGYEWLRAYGRAWLEHKITQWPTTWGHDLHILIYGDFEPLKSDLHFESLGITVHSERRTDTVIGCNNCVLDATVRIKEKSMDALVDASRRINVLLGTWTLITWGNSAIRWWSWITHEIGGAIVEPPPHDDLQRAVNSVLRLPPPVRQKVDAALYWLREPRNLMREFHRRDLLRIYSAYWNAFECLVEAVNILRPRPKVSKSEKRKRIDEFLSQRSDKLTPGDIEQCYREIVNPGLVDNASHALRECFGMAADKYIDECFRLTNTDDRLYNIRNAINHGEIDAENIDELLRIEARLTRLWLIVWGIFGRIVPFAAPAVSP